MLQAADDGGIAITLPNNVIVDQVGMSAGSAFIEGMNLAPLPSDANQSYERKPGGASGNGTDTNNNAADFFLNASSSNPQSLSSGCLDLSTADLGITKTASPNPIKQGNVLTYTLTVTNTGPTNATNVIQIAAIPTINRIAATSQLLLPFQYFLTRCRNATGRGFVSLSMTCLWPGG